MSRSRKLLTAGAILTLGLALAWPFRQSRDTLGTEKKVKNYPRAMNGDPIALDSTLPQRSKVHVPIAPEHVAARMASTNETSEQPNASQELESFDLANHPAIQTHPESASKAEPSTDIGPTPPEARPAYNVADRENDASSPNDWPQEVLHVVRNGDTLEGLAERYLDDAGRGLEIFDLNRDQLSNPYLLPIGVELRIPSQGPRPID